MSNFPILWGGDFNLTDDNLLDRWPCRSTQDTHSWQLKKVFETFNLLDSCRFLYPNQKLFTCKRKNNGSVTMSRIDKLLVSKHFEIVAYEHFDCEFSDHEIISTQVYYQSKLVFGKSPWRNNTILLKSENFSENFKSFWVNLKMKKRAMFCGNIMKWWNEVKYDTKRMLMTLGKSISLYEKREINMMKNTLSFLLDMLSVNPNSSVHVKQYFEYKNKLSSRQLKRAKEKILKDKADKYFFGDRPSKEFFENFKRRTDPSSKVIFEMKDKEGISKYETHEILEIAQSFYQDLFSEKGLRSNPDWEEVFFENIKKVPPEFFGMIIMPITVQEIWDAIKSFKDGKTPGVDGLSIEFYKKVFHIIKNEMVLVFNCYYERGFIPAKNKSGIITLIPKVEPLDEIINYRPINLLNVDLKIYTKILCSRIKPILCQILHESQYSQPGKNIGQLITTIRDLRVDMEQSANDSFFVSVDFMKAFDNVDHKYVQKLLIRMEFPNKFVKAFMSLYKNCSSKLIVNGMLSKRIRIKSGLRQGDPISKDVFNISLNPLLETLNKCQRIQKYKTISNQSFLTLGFVDDLNLITSWLDSLISALDRIETFRNISGFTINMGKTKGFFYNKEFMVPVSTLPSIRWVQDMKILGIKFGCAKWESEQWESKFLDFKKDIGFYKSKSPTLDAKAMLSKFKLCSLFSYLAQVFLVPQRLEEKINDMLVSFIVPHKRTFMTALDFSLPRQFGGYGISNIVLHLKLCFIKPIMQYMKEKVSGDGLSESMYFVEYNLGQQLSGRFELSRNNSTVHRFQPNEHYREMYDIVKKYNITLEELVDGKIGQVYKRILYDIGVDRGKGPEYNKMHKSIFPSYLKTFNYKVHFDLLPVKNKFHQFCLDSDVKITCPFCNINMESTFHIFAKCSKLTQLWEVFDETTRVCFGGECSYSFKVERVKKCHFDMVNGKYQKVYENLILYVNSVINHNIWKMRNTIFHEDKSFNIVRLLSKISDSLRGRRNIEKIEDRLTSCKKVDFLDEYHIALASIKDAMFDPG